MTKCGSMMTLARPLPLSLLQYCPTPGAWPMELASEACYPECFFFFFFFFMSSAGVLICSMLRSPPISSRTWRLNAHVAPAGERREF